MKYHENMNQTFETNYREESWVGFYSDRILFYLIKRFNAYLQEKNLDIQVAECAILKALYIAGDMSQSQIAQVLGKERSGISRSIVSMEKKGYIIRKPLNGTTNVVSITEKGRSLMPELIRITDSLEEQSFKGFSEKSRASLLNNLSRIYKNLKVED